MLRLVCLLVQNIWLATAEYNVHQILRIISVLIAVSAK